MNIINLNQVCKIVLVNRKQTTDIKVVEKSENIIQWFKNLFRKNKIRIKCFKYRWSLSNDIQPMDKLEEFLREYEEYSYNPTIGKFYERAHVTLWYSDYRHGNETIYFNNDKEAKEYFNKLVVYVKEHNVPFIDLYAEK